MVLPAVVSFSHAHGIMCKVDIAVVAFEKSVQKLEEANLEYRVPSVVRLTEECLDG